jgi:hypothetical protein
MQFKVFGSLVAALSLFMVAGCATQPVAQLSLNYMAPAHGAEAKSIKVALVKPQFAGTQSKAPTQMGGIFGSIMSAQLDKYATPEFTVSEKYNKDYAQRMQNSMLSDIEKILKAKGLNLSQSYDSFDEIPYGDKQKVEIIVVPSFDFGPQVSNKRSTVFIPFVGTRENDEGTVQFVGKLKVEFIEPMSKEKIIIKNIDVTSLGANYSAHYDSKDGAVNVLTDMLNSLYPLLMAKVEKITDVDEIQLSLKDIKRLKEKNQ